jgi:hypothetical protein
VRQAFLTSSLTGPRQAPDRRYRRGHCDDVGAPTLGRPHWGDHTGAPTLRRRVCGTGNPRSCPSFQRACGARNFRLLLCTLAPRHQCARRHCGSAAVGNHLFRGSYNIIDGKPEMLEHCSGRSGLAEAVQAYDGAVQPDVFEPAVRDAGFDGHAGAD